MPSIGEIAARLIGAREPLAFKKGSVCCIEVDDAAAVGAGRAAAGSSRRARCARSGAESGAGRAGRPPESYTMVPSGTTAPFGTMMMPLRM